MGIIEKNAYFQIYNLAFRKVTYFRKIIYEIYKESNVIGRCLARKTMKHISSL